MDNTANHPTVFPTRKHYTSPELRRLTGPEVTKRLSGTMKLHVLGVPHTITRKDFSTCAFTQKVLKLCAMMHRRGHHVIHYGVEGSEVECTEHVSLATEAEWSKWHKHPGNEQYVDGKNEEYLSTIYAPRLNVELKKRSGPPLTEILCMTWGGTGQRGGIVGVDQWEVETGIGYRHPWAPYRVFESYAWLHMHLGSEQLWNVPKWYWSVIPNAFDLNDFEFNATPGEDFLFMGRLNVDKGVGLAIHIAKEVGRKITIVGQGDPTPYFAGNPHVTYLPPVGPEDRKKLMMGAKALFCPTQYVEPFCGVHMEAMLCGTPVITSDHGIFTETVHHGVTGWRARNFEQFVWAAKNVDRLSRRATYEWATHNFSLERVALMYEEYFQSVLNVRGADGGFYLPNPDRQQLDWLTKCDLPEPLDPPDLNIPHIPPPRPEAKTGWAAEQDWERNWWGLEWGPHWDEEIRKQKAYFRLIGFPDDGDFGDKTVLDVGCGPVSMLLRTKHGFSRGVDPLAVSAATKARYANYVDPFGNASRVEFMNIKAEEMPYPFSTFKKGESPDVFTENDVRTFDEIWMYNCFAGETRFWANGQLVRLADAVGEEVEVLARDGQWRKATVRSFGKQRLQRVVFFPYRAHTSVTYAYDVTPDHRWITTNRGEVTDLRVGDRVLATPIAHENDSSFKDGFVHGLVFGDGHRLTGRDRFAIRLCGSKRSHLAVIKESAFHTGESYPPSYDGDPCVLLHAVGTDLKRLPSETGASLGYQAGFVAGWMAADGSPRRESASFVLCSINVDALNWLAERAPLLGWCVTGRSMASNMETNFGPRSAPLHSLTLRPEPTEYKVRAIVDEGREEEVFCVIEPETHTFTLEGGLITGNCLQHVDDPFEILRRMLACSHVGTTFRVFEWIDLGVCPGHPWNLTEDMFWKVFGGDDFERPIWNVGSLRDFGGTATNKYLAFVAVKK